jgi:hypothetical protein
MGWRLARSSLPISPSRRSSRRRAAALEVARQVDAIFVVDDLESAWRQVRPESEVLVEPEAVPTGGRFVVRHTNGDGRVIEYLDLSNAGG